MSNGDKPAFPHSDVEGHFHFGMTLREWLIGQALQGFYCSYCCTKEPDERVAKWAIGYADAVLAAMEKEPKTDG